MTDFLRRAGERLIEQDKDTRLEWHDDPVGFCRDCINWPRGASLADYQASTLGDVVKHKKVAVRSLHGTGKTTTEGLLLLWFAVTRDAAGIDWKCPTTAGGFRQLERYLWPEVHLWARRLRWDRIGRAPFNERNELLTLSLNLTHGSAFAVASNDPSLIEGAHAESLLYIFDESKSIAADTFDAAEGAFAGPGETFALACSTPGEPAGRFYDFHARTKGLEDWHPVHIKLRHAIKAGRVSRSWAEQRARQWGDKSALFRNRVLGEFAASDSDGVIPLAWVEAANERWQAWQDAGADFGPVTHLGVDVARSGADKTVLALRHGDVVSELRSYNLTDTMATVGYVAAVLRAHPDARALVDVIGVGGGVVDRLREQGFNKNTIAFNASAGSTRKDRSGELLFLNTRAAAWWHMREQLDPAYGATLALPPDDLLTGDLVAPHYSVTSSGKLQVESKEDIKKRIGRSTDSGDAVVQACFDAARGESAVWLEAWKKEIDERNSDPGAAARAEHPEMNRLQRHLSDVDRPAAGDVCRNAADRRHRFQRWPDGVQCVNCGGWREVA
jgi:hypothetical protein